MRNAFASEITSLAGENKNIVLLSADIGMRLLTNIKAVSLIVFSIVALPKQI